MMMREFEERTGFELTTEEYHQIEAEYMACDIDKDEFCKQWKKNGGIERMMRLRAREIEELKAEITRTDSKFEARIKSDDMRYKEQHERYQGMFDEMKLEIEALRDTLDGAYNRIRLEQKRADEAERKLEVLKEAFAIITGKEVE